MLGNGGLDTPRVGRKPWWPPHPLRIHKPLRGPHLLTLRPTRRRLRARRQPARITTEPTLPPPPQRLLLPPPIPGITPIADLELGAVVISEDPAHDDPSRR